jgi:D-arabinitol dehydrogenase (NADP+)
MITMTCALINQVHRLPDDLEMEQAALSEPLSCLAHGWDRIGPVHVGQRVLVIGAGIIGLLWTCLLHLRGFRKTVVVSETLEGRRQMARKLGKDGPSHFIIYTRW